MKLKKSFINLGIQKQNMKQHGWIGIVFFIALLFALPLQMFLLVSEVRNIEHLMIENVFDIAYSFQLFAIVLLPILAGIALFRYLHVKHATDMMHSLPIQRKSLFINHYLSGIVLLIPPLWIVSLSLFFVKDISLLFQEITAQDIVLWTVVMTVMVLLFYSFSVFVGMMTGLSVAQGVLTFILLVLPVALFYLIHANLALFLYGYSREYILGEWVIYLSPMIWLSELSYREFSFLPLIVYMLLCFVFIAVAIYLYERRPLEMAGQTFVFRFLRPVFKYGVTVCAMLVGAEYFSRYERTGWIVFGLVSGSLLGFLVAEIILEKTWRIWHKRLFLQYGVYASIIAVISIFVVTDVAGYETRIPEEEEIERVFLGNHPWALRSDELERENIFITDPAFISLVRSFHENIVTEQPTRFTVSEYEESYVIAYQLENGSLFVREYHLPETIAMEYAAPLVESKPYKESYYNLDKWERLPVESISFQSHYDNKRVTITDEKEITELRHILKYDIYALTANDFIGSQPIWGTIDIDVENTDDDVSILWNKSFVEVDKWLRHHGYVEKARTVAQEVAVMEVLPVSFERWSYPEQYFYNEEKYGQPIEITEETLIQEALQHSRDAGRGHYVVRFILHDRGELFGFLQSDDLSEKFIQAME